MHSGQGFIGSFGLPYDPSDLASLILIRIIQKERTLYCLQIRERLQQVDLTRTI